MSRPRKTKRRRGGGQPGNKNALKHGFYSDLYTVNETRHQAQPARVEDEQELVRTFIHTLALALRKEFLPTHFDRLLAAVECVNTIERTILLARGKGGDVGDTILEALRALDPHVDL